jgi:membrane associated rhomboid family serine protease
MIVPILNGLLRLKQVPMTWILFILNAIVFFAGIVPTMTSQTGINQYLDDDQFLRTQGRMFSQFITEHPAGYSTLLHKLAKRGTSGDPEKLKMLGALAVRDSEFMNDGLDLKYHGDEIEIQDWREKISRLKFFQESHPSYMLGLTSDDLGVSRWLTYIFVHSGGYHFIGNMYFLLIFGSMLEPIIGGLALLIVFLLSGMVGAGTFLLISGPTAAPLIGASGAVSGLMALFSFLYWKTSVRYVYFLLPSPHYVGVVFLPAWTVLGMFLLSDLAGYWGNVDDFGGVAYAAHLGGEGVAFLIGLIVYLLRFRNSPSAQPIRLPAPSLQVGRFYSIAQQMRMPR